MYSIACLFSVIEYVIQEWKSLNLFLRANIIIRKVAALFCKTLCYVSEVQYKISVSKPEAH